MSSWDDPPETFQWGVGQRTTSYGYCGTLNMSAEDKAKARERERKKEAGEWHFGFVSNSGGSSPDPPNPR